MSSSTQRGGRSFSTPTGRRWAAASPGGSFDARFPAYRMVNALVGITWSCNAWVEYRDPARPLRNERTLRLLSTYFSEEFLDLIRRDCFATQ